jgi:hypothetical protein
MSQPEYPLFSKKHQRLQRNWRGGYNFEKSREFELAERWFEERRETRPQTNHPKPKTPTIKSKTPPIKSIIQPLSPIIQPLPPPSIALVPPQNHFNWLKSSSPPGLNKSQPKFCKKCSKILSNPIMIDCCKSCFCLSCLVLHIDLFNRCLSCKAIVDKDLYELYDGCDISIPSYQDFDYQEPIEQPIFKDIPSIKSSLVSIEDNFSTPLLIDGECSDIQTEEQYFEESNTNVETEDLQNIMFNNMQLYLQYMMIASMFPSFVPVIE